MSKFGIKLVSFRGEIVDIWLHEAQNRLEYESYAEAVNVKHEYAISNKGNKYIVAPLPDAPKRFEIVAPENFRFSNGKKILYADTKEEAECLRQMLPLEPIRRRKIAAAS